MLRGLTLTTALLVATLEPTFSPGDDPSNLVKYGITQGGLVLVVLVIVWSYRRDFMALFRNEALKTSVVSEQNSLLVELVRSTTDALAHSNALAESQKDATHRLAKAVELLERRMDERRGDRRVN